MAVTDIKAFYNGWGGSDTQVTTQYTVTTDSKSDSAAVVIDSPLTPKVYDKLADNNLYIILPGGVTVSRIDGNAFQWRLTAVYTKSGFSFASRDDSDRLISFSTTTRVYTHSPTSAWESYNRATKERKRSKSKPEVPILNSSGDRFDPADIQDEYYNTVLNWTQREERNFDYIGALENKGTVNLKETSVLGVQIAKGAGLLRNVDPKLSVDENGDFEWICSYSLELSDDRDFWLNILDRGFYATIDGDKKEITNADIKRNRGETPKAADEQTPASEPQALDGDGGLQAWDAVNKLYTPVYLDYRTKRQKDWEKTLNLIAEQVRTV